MKTPALRARLIGAAVVAAFAGAGAFALSEAPRWIERRIRSEITGAASSLGLESSIGTIQFDWRRGRVRVSPIAIFGARGPGDPALLEVRAIDVVISWSALFRARVAIDAVVADAPRASILIRRDGTSNLPLRFDGQDPGRIFDLALGHITVTEGEVQFGDRRIPVNVSIDGVRSVIRFDASRRAYAGTLVADRLRGTPVPLRLDAEFALHPERAEILSYRFEAPRSRIEGAASFRNWQRLEGEFQANALLAVDEARRFPGWSFLSGGSFAAQITGALASEWRLAGPVRLDRTRLQAAGQTFENLSAEAEASWVDSRLRFDKLVISAAEDQDAKGQPRGKLQGTAAVTSGRDYELDLELSRFPGPGAVSTLASGRVWIAGGERGPSTVTAKVRLEPGGGPAPRLSGRLDLDLDVPSNRLRIAPSDLRWGQTSAELAGVLDQELRVALRTGDVNDIVAIARALRAGPVEIPFQIPAGLAEFRGVVTGKLEDARIAGTLRSGPVAFDGAAVDSIQARLTASRREVELDSLRVEHSSGQWTGNVAASLDNWRAGAGSALRGAIAASAVRLQAFEARLGGFASVRAAISGTLSDPRVEGQAAGTGVTWAGRTGRASRALVRFAGTANRIDLAEIRFERDREELTGSGFWSPSAVELRLATAGWDLARETPMQFLTSASGALQVALAKRGPAWELSAIDGELKAVGRGGLRARIAARGKGERLSLEGDVAAGDSRADFAGTWPLGSDQPGQGVLSIPSLSLRTAYTLLGREAPPFDGKLRGTAAVSGRLRDPETWIADAVLPLVEFTPQPGNVPPGMAAADLTLRNDGEVLLTAGAAGIVARRARFTAKETELRGQGNISFRRRNAWNLLLEGKVNLAVASTFRPDLVSSGTSTLTARLRGPLETPDLDGRLRFADAAISVRGFANGLDQVNGSVRFDRRRINIETLTGQSGGGNVRLGGYLGFSEELAYQLQAQLGQVRIRYPEGVSTTANATLSLTGTRRRGLLAGTITILRAGLTPATDVAALMSGAANPVAVPPANELLRGLRYDVRVETAQSAEFVTQLTRNVEADVDLQLRGSVDRPSLLGRISITQGQVQFFGTGYSINRGEIEFANPVRIDPQMDLVLETRVRGINVSIRFTGPPNKMNMSYRSDPPLQSAEILALLAVGRAPNLGAPSSGAGLNTRDVLSSGGSAILDSAVASGVNSPLERFFGVTRLKLDPQLIGLDNTPQARVSFEQQISRDVTVTYVQALNRAQQQLVRVQWDWSPQWSAIATRDENGVLSVDFVYKRSLR